jgi:hypothetical protein
MAQSIRRWAPPFVTVVTTSMSLAGCDPKRDDGPTVNPPQALPQWAEVSSRHPEGATNPPSPVLEVHPDGRCFKSWEGGLGGLPADVTSTKVGGQTFFVRFLDERGVIRGKEVVCPEGAAKIDKPDAGDSGAR